METRFLDFECAKCQSIIQFTLPKNLEYECPNCQNPTLIPFVSEHTKMLDSLKFFQNKIRFFSKAYLGFRDYLADALGRIDKIDCALIALERRVKELEDGTEENSDEMIH